jgi:hypothetical protein
LHYCDRETITVEKPFSIKCDLIVSAAPPSSRPTHPKRRRILTLAIQHVQPPRVLVSPDIVSFSDAHITSPRGPSSSTHTPGSSSLVSKSPALLQGASRQSGDDAEQLGSTFTEVPLLPAPFAQGADEINFAGPSSVLFLGNSTINLDSIELTCDEGEAPRADADDSDVSNEYASEHVLTTRNFELVYMPLQKGFCTFGGLRVLLLEDKLADGDGIVSDDAANQKERISQRVPTRILKEWSVVGEVWVKT